ncbi:mCG148456 [Mus musculus]|jgi:hypothetical protein|nr:mCG148456 [Mus musculus]
MVSRHGGLDSRQPATIKPFSRGPATTQRCTASSWNGEERSSQATETAQKTRPYSWNSPRDQSRARGARVTFRLLLPRSLETETWSLSRHTAMAEITQLWVLPCQKCHSSLIYSTITSLAQPMSPDSGVYLGHLMENELTVPLKPCKLGVRGLLDVSSPLSLCSRQLSLPSLEETEKQEGDKLSLDQNDRQGAPGPGEDEGTWTRLLQPECHSPGR